MIWSSSSATCDQTRKRRLVAHAVVSTRLMKKKLKFLKLLELFEVASLNEDGWKMRKRWSGWQSGRSADWQKAPL